MKQDSTRSGLEPTLNMSVEKNVRVRDIRTMLANGHVVAEKEAGAGLKFSAVCNSVALNDTTPVNNKEPSVNCGILSFSGTRATDNVKLEIDEERSIDDDNFVLRIFDDDENETPEMKFDLKLDQSPTEDECLPRQLCAPNSKQVTNRSHPSADLEHATSGTVDNADGKAEKLTVEIADVTSLHPADDCVLRSRKATNNCVWCVKQFITRKSLKCHMRSHLKALKHDVKDDLASTLEADNATVDDIEANVSSDFDCVFCEKSFPSKKAVIVHYLDVHRQPDSQFDGRPKNTALNGPYWQARENKTPDTPASAPAICGSAEDSLAACSIDENGTNEDTSKQYKCYLCNKQFSRNSSLVWHLQFHETFGKNNSEPVTSSSAAADTDDTVPERDENVSHTCNTNRNNFLQPLHTAHEVNGEKASPLHQKTSGYQCESCGRAFSTPSNMRKHARKHCKGPLSVPESEEEEEEDEDEIEDPLKEFPCDICDRSFFSQRAVRIHRSSKHRDEVDDTVASNTRTDELIPCDSYTENREGFQCTVCDKMFETRRGVIRHIGYHRSAVNETIKSSSTSVNGTLNNDDDDDDNSCIDEEEDSVPCLVCGKVFSSIRGMRIHANIHTEKNESEEEDDDTVDDKVLCLVCGKVFSSVRGMRIHANIHTEKNESDEENDDTVEDKAVCRVCGKVFSSVRGMRIHANIHTEKNESGEENDDIDEDKSKSSFECPRCNKTFEGFRSYKIHIGWHSRREETVVVPSKISDPSKTVVPQKKADESEVEVTSLKKSDKSETVVAAQEKPDKNTPSTSASANVHHCQYCPRQYATQQALAGHMKVHQAGKTDASQGSHQPEKAISETKTETCQVCGQNFSSDSSLNEHMKLHVAEPIPTTSSNKPLTLEDTMECSICNKFFMRKQDIAKHMRDHINGSITKENVDLSLFPCMHCKKSFVGRKSLITHQRLHEEAQVALKRAASQLPADGLLAKQPRLNDLAAPAQDDAIGWGNMIPNYQCEICQCMLPTEQSLQYHMAWHARMGEAHGLSTLVTNDVKVPTVTSSTPELVGTSSDEHCVAQNEVPEIAPVQDVKELGELVIIECVGGGKECIVFSQPENMMVQCEECDERYSNKLQMIVHMASHVSQRLANGCLGSLTITANPIMLAPFECKFCDERFVNKAFRRSHIAKRHADDVMLCDKCPKLFYSKWKLTEHCGEHARSTPYNCNHCLEGFTSESFLLEHQRGVCHGRFSEPMEEEKKLVISDVAFPSP